MCVILFPTIVTQLSAFWQLKTSLVIKKEFVDIFEYQTGNREAPL